MNEISRCPKCGQPLPQDAPEGLCPRCLGALNLDSDTGVTGAPAATATPPPSAVELAPHFPQLEILELLGRGGMGVVYKVRQKELDRFAALKILPPGVGGDAAFADRFAREAKALARLNHPGIVTIYDSGRTDGLYYFLMEFVDGVSLGQLMRGARVSPREALAIVPQICDALQYAHDQGIVHRDIKPENILLDRQGRVKVADFGLAKLVGGAQKPLTPALSASEGERVAGRPGEETTPALTDAGKVMGTPAYMAPEQAEHPGEVDHRADIYALGVVFYQMLTGELPGKHLEPPSKKVQIDVRLDEVVLRALERKPELRYQQASVLKTQVETIAATPDSSSRRGNAPQTETRKSESRLTSSPISQSPRFSRTTIVAACWAPLFFIAFVLMLWPQAVAAGEYHGPAWWQYLLMFTLLPLGITAPFGTTILGWVAVSQIRRSEGKLYGLGLAVLDGLLFPLLVLDGVIIGAVCLGLRLLEQELNRRSDSAVGVPLLLLVPVVLGIVALADYVIIGRVWRAVKQPVAGSPPPCEKPGRVWRWPVVTLVALAGLGTAAVVLWLSMGERPGGAEVRYRVFEIEPAVAEKLVPMSRRENGASGNWQVADISPTTLNALLDGRVPEPALMVDRKLPVPRRSSKVFVTTSKPDVKTIQQQVIGGWPIVADNWGYSRSENGSAYAVSGSGYFGVRRKDGELQVRIEHDLTYTMGNRPAVDVQIDCEGNAPQSGRLAFFIPFAKQNDTTGCLVLAVEAHDEVSNSAKPISLKAAEQASSPKAAPGSAATQQAAEAPASPRTVEDVLARYAQARGEMAGPDKARTLTVKGVFTSRDGMPSMQAEALVKAPDKWLLLLKDANGPVWRRAFDGSVGWEISNWGRPDVDPTNLLINRVLIGIYRGDPLTTLLPNASLKGQEPIGAGRANVIEVALPGKTARLWFDTQTGLLVRVEYAIDRLVEQMDFGDYRNIGGLMVPFTLRESGTENCNIECREVKLNEPIEDTTFKRPAGR